MYHTYEQLKTVAIKAGIPDSRMHIAIWAQLNGYVKVRKQINNIRQTYYFKPYETIEEK
ncbi:hypothetical protein M2459_002638 [Parabacteroides sp. PF5-5]|nr:hypothetical protein [Parabacteroides sp. PH5-39]MDH6316934.1 hypothetical protein [Parabacteroides sp. PF5-13]MDH6321003.1 hypothetical protein [Parabacteroides sp. PH5-13]MDH6324735.1 hypothetical protein [Parabacteroides sp. PH5-8]MDH6328119.1 hypothetical protein [Parabacteroides sp. PH5-41]MDH6335873.1 hypothetical protein [Parabacteroides sp. PF5-5]MDH6346985.1 hypothetical protein [Parabacteroides sp. PH5-46]MDH6361947.1 hypothetical protein [Parabacteroides sp. PH5-16]MDH6377615.